jgi:hypothetical protein
MKPTSNNLITGKGEVLVSPENPKDYPEYGWFRTGTTVYLNLGKMKKAIVIRTTFQSPYKYFISNGSYFPFTDEIYEARFDSKEEAKEVATRYLTDWFGETMKELGL